MFRPHSLGLVMAGCNSAVKVWNRRRAEELSIDCLVTWLISVDADTGPFSVLQKSRHNVIWIFFFFFKVFIKIWVFWNSYVTQLPAQILPEAWTNKSLFNQILKTIKMCLLYSKAFNSPFRLFDLQFKKVTFASSILKARIYHPHSVCNNLQHY